METIEVLRKVKRELWIRNRFNSKITKGNYIVIDIPYELQESFEIEVMIQMVLEDMAEVCDTHFDYEFLFDQIKIYVLN